MRGKHETMIRHSTKHWLFAMWCMLYSISVGSCISAVMVLSKWNTKPRLNNVVWQLVFTGSHLGPHAKGSRPHYLGYLQYILMHVCLYEWGQWTICLEIWMLHTYQALLDEWGQPYPCPANTCVLPVQSAHTHTHTSCKHAISEYIHASINSI